ncbi:hypothetical protein C8Q70DRAFT_88803 [Cubamyces menziesii]|nr:hypothetical protein C8Q70DRAFT_88803 [Cubamyces menziesii]
MTCRPTRLAKFLPAMPLWALALKNLELRLRARPAARLPGSLALGGVGAHPHTLPLFARRTIPRLAPGAERCVENSSLRASKLWVLALGPWRSWGRRGRVALGTQGARPEAF